MGSVGVGWGVGVCVCMCAMYVWAPEYAPVYKDECCFSGQRPFYNHWSDLHVLYPGHYELGVHIIKIAHYHTSSILRGSHNIMQDCVDPAMGYDMVLMFIWRNVYLKVND